ncbi:hypothetical protein [Polaromonas sp.]
MNKPSEIPDEKPPAFDDVLKRMLDKPPAPKVKPKPEAKKPNPSKKD